MASYPVTVYRWDDPGAPQMPNRTPSEIINVLKKCLVEGYGTKNPLGWAMPFEDATNYKVAFRNNVAAGGSGGYVQIKSGNGTDSNGMNLHLTPAKSMIDINTFHHRGYTRPYSTNTGWSNWVLIGTAIGFYFIAGTTGGMAGWANSHREQVMYVGDFTSYIPNDAGLFIVASALGLTGGDNTTLSSISFTQGFINNTINDGSPGIPGSQYPVKIYDSDNFDSASNYNITFPSGFSNSTAIARIVEVEKKRDIYTKPLIAATSINASNNSDGDRDGTLRQLSDLSPRVRGELPGGLIEVCPRYGAQDWPVTEIINTHNHWLLRNPAGWLAYYWINMVEWA